MVKTKKQLRQQRLKRRIFAAAISLFFGLLVAGLVIAGSKVPVLQPAGPIASGEKQLLVTAFLMMLIVVLPVFTILFLVIWRYRETNTKATYRPNWDGSRVFEAVWWIIPGVLVTVLGLLTWRGTFQYDPYKALAVKRDTVHVQVIALDWRWLFIYPDQGVASINELHIPVKKSVQFDITADAPMNSFWIPQLGGQVYAMPGMGTRLHLMAARPGSYYGSSANISGKGFAGMHFQTIATDQSSFNTWVAQAQRQPALSEATYRQLAKPSMDHSVRMFSKPSNGLYGAVINKYMSMPANDTSMSSNMHMESM